MLGLQANHVLRPVGALRRFSESHTQSLNGNFEEVAMKMNSCSIVAVSLIFLGAGLSSQESKSANPTAAVAAKTSPPSLDLTNIGNAGFMMQAGGKKVLVDALFEGSTDVLGPSPELLSQMMDAHGPFADVDLLMVTHPHGDHFNPKLVVEFFCAITRIASSSPTRKSSIFCARRKASRRSRGRFTKSNWNPELMNTSPSTGLPSMRFA